jgi:uncharacterized protein YceK
MNFDWHFGYGKIKTMQRGNAIVLKSLSALVAAILLNGCASIYTQLDDHRKWNTHYALTVPRVYSGTVVDWDGLTADNLALIALLDLPLSFAVDTVSLPWTIYRQSKHGYLERDGVRTYNGEIIDIVASNKWLEASGETPAPQP